MTLTASERELLKAAGENNRRIALDRGVAHQTVKNQWSVIYEKLGTNSRQQAFLRAFLAGAL
jgi:DNA-binding NarL/FixJ family response regulator